MRTTRTRLLALIAATSWLAARDAAACSIILDDLFEPSTPGLETNPPGPVIAGEPTIAVPAFDEGGCGGGGDNSCSGLGRITVIIPVTATDDTTKPAELGYRLRFARGTAPFHATDFSRIRTAGEGIRLPADDAEFDVELGISAIDASGNVGPETIVHVVYQQDEGGCRAAKGRGSVTTFVIALGTLALVLRRRARPGR